MGVGFDMPGFQAWNLAAPSTSDFSQGAAGASTMTRASESVIAAENLESAPGPVVGSALAGTAAGHPVAWWGALVVVYFVWAWLERKEAGDKLGLYHIASNTLSCMIGFILLKWVMSYYKIPGLTQLMVAM